MPQQALKPDVPPGSAATVPATGPQPTPKTKLPSTTPVAVVDGEELFQLQERAIARPPIAPKPHITKVALASLIGTSIEWYDYFLYGTAAALVFNKLFFPKFDPLVGTLLALSTFTIGFIARPFGGLVFGHFGDRIGRKQMLYITLLFMGISSTIIGLLPTYARIGIWAPLLLVLMRICQGIGLGGEWGGAVLMAVEHAPNNRRGFYGAFPQTGAMVGGLLSTVAFLLVARLKEAELLAWGWRLPFLFSIFLVVVGIWIRMKIAESPAFEKIKNLKAEAKMPVVEAIRKHPKNLLVAMGMRFAENGLYYIITVFSLTYCVTVLKLSKSAFLPGLIINYCIGFFAMLAYGRLSDKIGRRAVYMWGAVVCGLLAFPFFSMMNKAPHNLLWGWLAIILMAQLGHSAMYGPQASFFAELFPARVRYSGASLGYQLASIFAGGMAPVVATALLAKAHNKTWPVSLYMLSFVVITIVAVIFAEETYRKKEV
jgi:MFS transporter, MHS family, shikimate and dehydroshikimate transport protein